jgi:hypothetical protein
MARAVSVSSSPPLSNTAAPQPRWKTSSAASNLDVRCFARPDLPPPLTASSAGRIEKALRGDAATRSRVESPNADVQDVFVSHRPMTLPSVSLK